MGICEDIQSLLEQIIKLSETVFVYNEQCSKIIHVLNEARSKITQLSNPESSIKNELRKLLNHLNKLYEIINGFTRENWYDKCPSINVMEPISQIDDIMKLISESLKNIKIPLENEYTSDPISISNDLVSLKGIFLDSDKFSDSQREEKLNEIQKNLPKLDNPKKKSRRPKRSHSHHGHKKKKKDSKSITTSSSQSISMDDDDDDDFIINNDPKQKYKLKRSSIMRDKKAIENNSLYTVYNGKLKKTKENIKIMVFHDIPNFEEKFKRIVNILTVAQNPNLESFVGSVEEPPYYCVVTRQIGEKLSSILMKENQAKKKSKKKQIQQKKFEQKDEQEQNEPKLKQEQNEQKIEHEQNEQKIEHDQNEQKVEHDQNKHKKDDHFQLNFNEGFRTIIAYNIAKAMAYLHSINITHRDLCSANVMVDKSFNPRIINFANSRFIPEDSLLNSLKLRGSSNFRAPEINDEYNESVDVFAYSGILYELLTGYPPFTNLNASEVENKIKNNERPEIPSDASDDLKKLIEDCWSQKQKVRPTFAEVIYRMLTNKITFPTDRDTINVAEFYAEKMIQNADLDSCLQMFSRISKEINNSIVYCKECYRVRSFLCNYQFVLQTSDLSKQKVLSSTEIEDEDYLSDSDIQESLPILKESLEDLLKVIENTMNPRFSKNALGYSSTEISKGIDLNMESIYKTLTDLGLNVNEYKLVKSDLAYDYRYIYSIFNDFKDKNDSKNLADHSLQDLAVIRMKEIEDFLEIHDIKITVAQSEIKNVLSQFMNFEKNRYDFTISGYIGYGASAKVFIGKQISTGKEVAIKEFEDNYITNNDNIIYLRREISFLVSLENEYLIPFIGFNLDDNQPLWIITQYIKNGDLYDANFSKRLKPFQKTKIAFQIAVGMEYLHSNHVIHRDLKTNNILLDGDTPKITDFGYSRLNLSLSMTNGVGTLFYMAPEVLKGNHYGYKADVFSFALILWELYYGNYPFYWLDKSCVADEISKNGANLKYDLKTPISDDLRKLIEDGKKINPDERPSFSDIIDRMIKYKIAYHGANINDVTDFYAKELEKRSKQ